jgi:hypothetical protein
MLRHLLNRGAKTEVQTEKGETPLYWAATSVAGNTMSSDKILIEARARIKSPLLLSLKNGDHNTLHQLLLLCNADTEPISAVRAALQETLTQCDDFCSECWSKLA